MKNYELFMIAERQYRIDQNKFEIKKVQKEMESIGPRYDSIVSKIEFLTDEYSRLENKLENLESDYSKYKNKKVLYHKSEYIQLLSESLEKKEKQIQFTHCLEKSSKYKRNILIILYSFHLFYKCKKSALLEEKEGNVSFIHLLFQYGRQYYIFKKNSCTIGKTYQTSELLSKYTFEKESLIAEIERLYLELEEIKKIIWGYPEQKIFLKNRLQEILNEIEKLYNLTDYIIYKQKEKELSDLYISNQNYQAQIEKLTEIDSEKSYVKEKRCA